MPEKKYVLRSTVYPSPIIYTAGARDEFADYLYGTDDPAQARELVKRDDVRLESGKLPGPAKPPAASE